MATIDNLTIDVSANITVDKRTAETCLKLVEMYVNKNRSIDLCVCHEDDGYLSYRFEDRNNGQIR